MIEPIHVAVLAMFRGEIPGVVKRRVAMDTAEITAWLAMNGCHMREADVLRTLHMGLTEDRWRKAMLSKHEVEIRRG